MEKTRTCRHGSIRADFKSSGDLAVTEQERQSLHLSFLLNDQQDALIIQIYSVIKLYMFRAFYLAIIRSFLLTFGTAKLHEGF